MQDKEYHESDHANNSNSDISPTEKWILPTHPRSGADDELFPSIETRDWIILRNERESKFFREEKWKWLLYVIERR